MLRFSSDRDQTPDTTSNYRQQVRDAMAARRREQFPQLEAGARRRNAIIMQPRRIANPKH